MKTAHSIPAFCFILLLYAAVAFFRLEELPGEWFGDISNLHEYVVDIQQGKFPVTYRQGVGPLYHYLIAPFTLITGQRYIGYKILSVLAGAFSLISIYVFAEQLTNRKTALITMAITAVSFWFLVWARLGNLHAILPGIVALSFYFLLRYQKTERMHFLVWGSILATSGFFWYLGTVMLPFAFLFVCFLTERKKSTSSAGIVCAIILIGLALFVGAILLDPFEFFSPSGYIGEKYLNSATISSPDLLQRVLLYPVKLLLMLHIRGDVVFRVNVPGSPLLDPISGGAFLIGLFGVVRAKKYRAYFLAPLLLVLPSIFPTLLPIQVPSATRTFAATPFIFLLAGIGLTEVGRVLKKAGDVFIIVLLIVIGAFNGLKYFDMYPSVLPDHNTPIGAWIATMVDALPSSRPVYLMDCCWGEWRQPDPKGIYYQLKNKKGRENILSPVVDIRCEKIDWNTQPVFIVNPIQKELIAHLNQCKPGIPVVNQTRSDGKVMFVTVGK